VAQSATPTHCEVERRMRVLVREAGLPEPDEVRYEFDPDEVVLKWRDRKLAVVVDLQEGQQTDIELATHHGGAQR
jgi:hypothetical protein